jgi:hypothetical protein
MTVLRDVSPPGNPWSSAPTNTFHGLVDDMAWQHLGITGEEFKRLWYSGAYKDDARPVARALDRLLRTGQWQLS